MSVRIANIALLLLSLATPAQLWADAREILDRAAQVAIPEGFSLICETKQEISAPFAEEKHNTFYRQSISRRAEKWRLDSTSWKYQREHDLPDDETVSNVQYLCDGSRLYEYRPEPSGHVAIRPLRALRQVFFSQWGMQIFERASGDAASVLTLVRKPDTQLSVRPEREKVADHECDVITGQNAHGRMTLWIAPDLGYAVLRLRHEIGANDLYYGRKLGEEMRLSANARKRMPEHALLPRQNLVLEWKVASVVQHGEYWLPQRATHIQTISHGDNRITTATATVSVTSFTLEPAFPKDHFEAEFPNGTACYDEETPQLTYEWQDGELVPLYDQATIRQIERDVEKHR
jgi:hypothetical protein